MRIALLPGSFNPVHNGHLRIARHMVEREGMDEARLVVTPQNPFKEPGELADSGLRLKMARAAVKGEDKISVSDAEYRLPVPSYTINTLRYFRQAEPGNEWFLVIGSDAYRDFSRWKDHEELLESCTLCVYSRPGAAASNVLPGVVFLDAPEVGISSTEIRTLVAAGSPVGRLVPKEVEEIIREEGLYR